MKEKLSFAILNPQLDSIEVIPVERESKKNDWVLWGTDNKYPNIVFDASRNATNMNTIINTVINYVVGDGIDGIDDELLHDIAESYAVFGGFAIDVVKNNAGEISRVECLDMRFIRTNKTHDFIVYNEDYANRTGYVSQVKSLILPTQVNNNAQEYVYLFTNSKYTVYPRPEWESSLQECLIEIGVTNYHLNGLKNGLNDTVLFNFVDGVPEDEEKEEIERAIDEKFLGAENACRPIIKFSSSADSALQVDTITTSNWADKYTALTNHVKEKQFASWRCAPSLCGIVERGTGFNATEYQEEYALFEANVIKPIRRKIEKALAEIYNREISIKPFVVNFPTV